MPSNVFFSCLPRFSSGWGTSHPEFAFKNKPVAPHNSFPGTIHTDHTNIENNQTSTGPGNMLAQELLQAQEQERQHLANELHDNLGQILILLKNQVLKLKNIPPEKSDTLAQLSTLSNLTTASLQHVRNISYQLRPYELDLLGLNQALLGLAQVTADTVSWPLTVDLSLLDQLFPKEREIYIYRIMQECLQIIQNQTEVTGVRIGACTRPTAVIWEIHVSGPATFFSFLATEFLKNFALCRLQEYLNIMAGRITFIASTPRTTIMQINIPLSSKNLDHENT